MEFTGTSYLVQSSSDGRTWVRSLVTVCWQAASLFTSSVMVRRGISYNRTTLALIPNTMTAMVYISMVIELVLPFMNGIEQTFSTR